MIFKKNFKKFDSSLNHLFNSLAEELFIYKFNKRTIITNILLNNIEKNYTLIKKIPQKEAKRLLSTKNELDCLLFFKDYRYYSIKRDFNKTKPYNIAGFDLNILDKNSSNRILIFRNLKLLKLTLIALKPSDNFSNLVAFLHGAGVAKNKAILFLGEKKAGKSSICYYLNEIGFDIIGDDKIILTKKGKNLFIHSPYNLIKLRPKVKVDNDNLIAYKGRRFLEIPCDRQSKLDFIYLIKKTKGNTRLSKPEDFSSAYDSFDKLIYHLCKDSIDDLKNHIKDLYYQDKIKMLYINWKEKKIVLKLKDQIIDSHL